MVFLILAYNKPRYLYVCLDSVFRIKGVPDVVVSVDGGGDKKDAVLDVLDEFPLAGKMVRRDNVTNMRNLTYSVQALLSFGYKEVVYLESDFLIRSDVMAWLNRAPRDALFLSISGRKEQLTTGNYRQLGNLVTADRFEPVYRYVAEGKYIGKKRPGYEQVLKPDHKGHSAAFLLYHIENNTQTRWSDKRYIAHFGVVGVNSRETDETRLLESEMFCGPKETWLDNVLRVFHKSDHKCFRPKDYEYE